MNKITIAMLAMLALAMLLVAGCASKQSGTGYVTYSGGNQPQVQGGGGCGRFAEAAGTGSEVQAQITAAQDTADSIRF